MDDGSVLIQIHELVDQEHQLRRHATAGHALSMVERLRLEHLEEQLDQCWDLLRRRRAREEYGQDPDGETLRPGRQVETYLQ